jgi:hypothetical protein
MGLNNNTPTRREQYSNKRRMQGEEPKRGWEIFNFP